MREFTERVKMNAKDGLFQFSIFLVRAISGVLLGLTVALVGQEIMGFKQLIFMFIVITTTAVVLRLTKGWGLLSSVIILLVLVLIGVLLKLYVHTAALA